jgi:hypothetical protein
MAVKEVSNNAYDFDAQAPAILGYGPPGSGKTWFLGTMPKNYIFTTDKRGLMTLKFSGKTFNGVTVDTLDELNAVLDEALAGTRAKDAGSFGLDHISEITELAVKKVGLREAPSTHKRSKWGEVSDHVRMITRKFIDLSVKRKVPVCAVAHQRMDKDEFTQNIIGSPDTVGKFSQTIGGFFDLFLYFKQDLEWDAGKQIKKFTVSTINYLQFQAKDRTSTLDVVEPNDFPTMYAKIMARLEELKEGQNARS